MIAHFHAHIRNAAELARSIGRSESTARGYLDTLPGAFVVRVLPPWFEFKYTDAPKRTRSMRVAIRDLSLERLWVVHPGAKEYDLGKRISVIPLKAQSRVVGGRR